METSTWRLIEGFLQRTRRRFFALRFLQSAASAVFGLGLGLSLLMLWKAWNPPSFSLRPFLLLALLAASLWLLRGLLSSRLKDDTLARRVEAWEPDASGFLTALDLSRSLQKTHEHPPFSKELAEARIAQVSEALVTIQPHDIVPVEPLKRPAYLLFGLSFVFFSSLLAFPEPTSRLLSSLWSPPSLKKMSLLPDDGELVVGDLQITYTYPAYTRMSPRTLPNSDGSLSALKGTQVRLQARAFQPLRRASLLVDNQKVIPLSLAVDEMTLEGRFPLLKTGFYRLQILEKSGRLRLGPIHSIHVQEDRYPKIKLISPDKDLQAHEREKLLLSFEISDDFGISKIALVFRNLSDRQPKEDTKVLKVLEPALPEAKIEIPWDLATMAFAPGDEVSFQIEVLDNDTISGPKKTRSESRKVKIFSPVEQHERLLDQQQALLNQMILLLADLLEAPEAKDIQREAFLRFLGGLNTAGDRILEGFASLFPLMSKDPMTKPYVLVALENLRIRFSSRHSSRVDLAQQLTPELDELSNRALYSGLLQADTPPQEDDVYAFSLLLRRQKLDLIRLLSKALAASQAKLQELLEEYKKNRSPETKAALLQEMRRMERLIKQISERMQKLRSLFSVNEFLNMQALNKEKNLKNLRDMQKLVQEDKLEDAAKKLSEMAQDLESMISKMDRFSQEAGGQSAQMEAAVKKMMQSLQQLEEKQRRLSKNTHQIQRDVSRRMQEQMKKQIESLVQRQLKRLEEMKKHLKQSEEKIGGDSKRFNYQASYKRMQSNLSQLEQTLKNKDLFESLEQIRRFLPEPENLHQYLQYQQSLLRSPFQRRFEIDLDGQLKRLRDRDPQEESRRAERLASLQRGQEELRSTSGLGEKIRDDLENAFPKPQSHLSPKEQQQLQRYQQQQASLRREASQIRRQMQEMGQKMPIFSPKMSQSLDEAMQEMKGARQQLRQRDPRQAHGHQEQAAERLKQTRQKMQQMMQQQGKGGDGSRQRPREKIEIPDASKHKAPKALREDILDAMKEKVPKPYEEPVRRYYEKLVK